MYNLKAKDLQVRSGIHKGHQKRDLLVERQGSALMIHKGREVEPAIWGRDLEREQKARVALYSPEARRYSRAVCYHKAVCLLASCETTQVQTMAWRETELVANTQVFAHSLSSYISCGFGLFQMLGSQKCLTPDKIYFCF